MCVRVLFVDTWCGSPNVRVSECVSLCVAVRVLPQLHRASVTPGTSELVSGREPCLTYRLLVSDPKRHSTYASEFGAGVRTATFVYPKLDSVFGELHMQVKYRTDCQFQVGCAEIGGSPIPRAIGLCVCVCV